jgi:hypothetical protein
MSGWSSRAEVVDMLRRGIETDYNGLGYPRDPSRFNVSGIVRDLFYNSGAYGWRANDTACDRGGYEETLRLHYRPKRRARVTRPEGHGVTYAGRHAAEVTDHAHA